MNVLDRPWGLDLTCIRLPRSALDFDLQCAAQGRERSDSVVQLSLPHVSDQHEMERFHIMAAREEELRMSKTEAREAERKVAQELSDMERGHIGKRVMKVVRCVL